MLLTIKQLQVKYGNQTALQIDEPISFERGERIWGWWIIREMSYHS